MNRPTLFAIAFVLGACGIAPAHAVDSATEPQPIRELLERKSDLPANDTMYPYCADITVNQFNEIELKNNCQYWVHARIANRFEDEWFWLEPGNVRETSTFSAVFMPSVVAEAGPPPSGGLEAAADIDIRYTKWGKSAMVFCQNKGRQPALVQIRWYHSSKPFGETAIICEPGIRDRIFTFPIDEARDWASKLLIASWEPL